MKRLIKGSLASGIETARKVNEIVDWINKHEKEDVPEEPKEYWHIFGTNLTKTREGLDELYDKRNKEIGNRFDTKEETERAVEKLEAFTRLKNKGLVWQGWEESAMDNGMCIVGIQIPEDNWETDVVRDLDLLFGGEE